MKVTLYVIRGILSGKKYIGISNDLQRRLREHLDGNLKGGQQLIGDFELIHTEEFDDYISARKREIFLKSGQRRKWINSVMKTRPTRGG